MTEDILEHHARAITPLWIEMSVNYTITIRQKMRNKRIKHKKTPWERPFAVIKNIFNSGHQLFTTKNRIHTKNIFSCLTYNLQQLITLQKKHHLANAIKILSKKNNQKHTKTCEIRTRTKLKQNNKPIKYKKT